MVDFVLELFETFEEQLTELSQNPWFLLLLFFVVMFDSVIPLLPSEFSVIAGGVAAGAGTLIDDQRFTSLVLVIVIGALGAYAGDSLAYLIGNRSDRLAKKVFFRGEKGRARLEATSNQIQKRGGLLLVTARFIPGGRTAMTFSCGLTNQPFISWFTKWDLLATSLWAGYAALLGFFVAGAVENQSTAIWLAFGVAISVSILVEGVRWLRERSRSRPEEQEELDQAEVSAS